MKIFISYSASEHTLAQQLAYSLRGEGHSVFFDRDSLPAGENYDSRIRSAVQQCDLFIFLVSPESVSPGSYALTELGMAQDKWDHPSGRVLPVADSEMNLETLPPYLRAITILRPAGDLVAEVVEAVDQARLRRRKARLYKMALLLIPFLLLGGLSIRYHDEVLAYINPTARDVEPVNVYGQISNSGWTLIFDIIGNQPVREIFYRFADEATFKSTGHVRSRNPQTGLPAPRYSVTVPHFTGKRTLMVKYTDPSGHEHGPYEVDFDATEQLVAGSKEILEMTKDSWVAFREFPEGHMLLYFTHLLSHKTALKEIQYSVDDEALSREVRFTSGSPGSGASEISDDDELFLEIPMSTTFVYVKLIFIDGSESPARRFVVPDDLRSG